MDYISLIFALLLLIAFSALFSGMEIAYLSTDRLRLLIDKSRGGPVSSVLRRLFRNTGLYITTMLVGNNIVLVMYGLVMSALLNPLLERLIPDWAVLILNSLIATFIILIFGEYLPKSYFKRNANQSMRRFAFPIYFIFILLYPVSLLCALISRMFIWMSGSANKEQAIAAKLTTIDLDHYLSVSAQSDGTAGKQPLDTEVKILQNAIDFSSVKARDCMVPRNEIVACDISASVEELKQLFVQTGYSKVVVYRDSIDDIVGYVHSSEMFRGPDWQHRMRKALFVPESAFGHKLMRQLMLRKQSLAVVIDELGGTAGIITLEDLVEEIFGEIEDEHDKETIVAKQIDEHNWVLSGRIEIDELNERFGLDLPEADDYNTLAGFVIHHCGSIPKSKEQVTIDKYRFTILKSTSSRIELLRLNILDD